MNQPQPAGTTWASVPHVQVGDEARYEITPRLASGYTPAGVVVRTRTATGALVATTVYTIPALFALVRDASLALERIEAAGLEVEIPTPANAPICICGTSRSVQCAAPSHGGKVDASFTWADVAAVAAVLAADEQVAS